tara:strand:+ start:71875 stop:72111 length:237 start_codon:yes stop_codon:yes gene_type:complete
MALFSYAAASVFSFAWLGCVKFVSKITFNRFVIAVEYRGNVDLSRRYLQTIRRFNMKILNDALVSVYTDEMSALADFE